MSDKKITINEILKIICITFSIIACVSYFVYKTNDLPPRVDKLERDVPAIRLELTNKINNLESKLERNDVKTDIILDDVKLIRSYILNSDKK